ncbi:MAG: diadenylate cyclase CdaA [Clostridiales bacterium]|nr:diadenylate cyclase CdaA [Candidatus Crickella caballi]
MIGEIAGIIASIGLTDVIDILIVAFLVYKATSFIRETRAQQLVRGIALVIITFAVSELFNLNLLNWLLKSLITVGIIALVVLFTPEIRRALEQLGRKGVLTDRFKDISREDSIATVHKIIDAVEDFASTKTGALIVIERDTMLNDIVGTGVVIDANLSVRLLGNLFYEGSPLHDGAVIIRGRKAYAASCVLPLTERTNIGGNLGTRHRAGVGVSEICDALVIIVSEETGAISIAEAGVLTRNIHIKTLEGKLIDIYLPEREAEKSFLQKILGGGNRDEQ